MVSALWTRVERRTNRRARRQFERYLWRVTATLYDYEWISSVWEAVTFGLTTVLLRVFYIGQSSSKFQQYKFACVTRRRRSIAPSSNLPRSELDYDKLGFRGNSPQIFANWIKHQPSDRLTGNKYHLCSIADITRRRWMFQWKVQRRE